MPEGDSYARAAIRVREVLADQSLTSVAGSSPAMRKWSGRILDATVSGVRTHGKRLLIDLDRGITISAHLGMNGRVQVFPGTRRPGSETLTLQTATHHVVFSAARVEVERTAVIDVGLERLGPDLLDPQFDSSRTRTAQFPKERSVSEFLLDQRVMAGVGNIFRNEVLFLEGIHPETAVGSLTAQQLNALIERARRLLTASASTSRRSTTGMAGPGRTTWVYDRAGLSCRRCRHRISMTPATGEIQSDRSARLTFWCPNCQPPTPPLESAAPEPPT
jgi:endonuclease-8